MKDKRSKIKIEILIWIALALAYFVIATPSITLNSPGNNTNTTNQNVSFNITLADADATFSCNLSIDNTVNRTSFSISASSTIVYATSNFTDGRYNWNVNCSNSSYYIATSTINTFSIDTAAPTPIIYNISHVYVYASQTINIWSTWVDSLLDVSSVWLNVNNVINTTNTSGTLNNTLVNFSYFIHGQYEETVINFTMSANDSVYNIATGTLLQVSILNKAPNFTLHSPIDNYNTQSTNITFNFTATDVDANLTCNLTINSTTNISNYNITTNYATAIYASSNLSTGTYNWNITCWDSSNNANTTIARTFTIDQQGPGQNSQGISESSAFVGETIYLWTNFSDALQTIDTIWFTVNSIVNTTNSSSGLDNKIINFSYYVPGQFENTVINFTLFANDTYNNTANGSIQQLTVLDRSPNFTLHSPIDTYNTTSNNITFNFTTYDVDSSITCNLTINGTVNISSFSATTSQPRAVYASSNFTDGNFTWNVTCWDNMENQNSTSTRWFAVDTTAPALNVYQGTTNTIYSVSTDTVYAGSTIYIWADYTDAVLNVESIWLTVNNITNQTNTSGNLKDKLINFSYTIPYEYENTVINFTILANDTVYNSATATIINVTIVNSPPSIFPADPVNNYKASSTNITFNLTAYDQNPPIRCNLTINNSINRTNIGITTGQYNTTYASSNFNEGIFYWNATCSDSSGNTNTSTTRYFIVDLTSPILNYYGEASQTIYNISSTTAYIGDTIYMWANYSDALLNISTVYITANGNTTTINNSNNLDYRLVNLSYTIPRHYENSVVNFTVNANDTVHNVATGTIMQVTVADRNPQLNINAPVNYYNTTSSNITFNFTVYDMNAPLRCNLTINSTVNISDISVSDAQHVSVYASELFTNNTYNWSVTCWDSNNNINISTTRNFTVDSAAPYNITYNISNSTIYVQDTIYIWANFTDDLMDISEVWFTVNNIINQTNTSGNLKNRLVNFSYIIPYSLDNSIANFTLNAKDILNNTATGTILSVTVLDSPPTIVRNSPANNHNSSSTNVTFSFTAYDGNLPITCNLSINNTVNQSGISPAYGAPETVYASDLFENNKTYDWTITCKDNNNNIRETSARTLKVDTVSPYIFSTASETIYNISNTSGKVSTYIYAWTNYSDSFLDIDTVWLTANKITVATNTTSLDGQLVNLSYQLPRQYEETIVNMTINANDTAGNTHNGTIIGVTVLDTTPPVPPDFTSSNISSGPGGNINITWSNISDSVKYMIFRHTGNFAAAAINYDTMFLANTTTTSYKDNSTLHGYKYYYRIVPIDNLSNYNFTNASSIQSTSVNDQVIPSIPLRISTDDLSSWNKIQVSWQHITDDINNNPDTYGLKYQVWWGTYIDLTSPANESLEFKSNVSYTSLNYTNITYTQDDTYYIAVTTVDDAGNYNLNLTTKNMDIISVIYMPPPTPGGGTGAIGGRDGYDPSNEVEVFTGLDAEELVEMEITKSHISAYYISFETLHSNRYIKIHIKNITQPKNVQAPLNKVFQYMDFRIYNDPSNINYVRENVIKNAKIEFKVPLYWLIKNRIDKKTVKLMRYNKEEWRLLKTEEINMDGIHVYYKAYTPGFSYFAIVGEKNSATKTQVMEQLRQDNPDEEEKEQAEEEKPSLKILPQKQKGRISIIIYILIGISVLLAVFAFNPGTLKYYKKVISRNLRYGLKAGKEKIARSKLQNLQRNKAIEQLQEYQKRKAREDLKVTQERKAQQQIQDLQKQKKEEEKKQQQRIEEEKKRKQEEEHRKLQEIEDAEKRKLEAEVEEQLKDFKQNLNKSHEKFEFNKRDISTTQKRISLIPSSWTYKEKQKQEPKAKQPEASAAVTIEPEKRKEEKKPRFISKLWKQTKKPVQESTIKPSKTDAITTAETEQPKALSEASTAVTSQIATTQTITDQTQIQTSQTQTSTSQTPTTTIEEKPESLISRLQNIYTKHELQNRICKEMKSNIRLMSNKLKYNRKESAKIIYQKIQSLYNQLDKKAKAKFYPRIKNIYEELIR